MRTTVFALLGSIAAGALQPAAASDGEGRFALKGIGAITCKRMVDIVSAKDERTLLLVGWLEGFVTSENQRVTGLFDATPWQPTELLAMLLTTHCQNRPDQPVYQAVQLMLETMRATSLKTQSPVELIDIGDGQKMEIYREIMRLAQQRLIELEYLSGGADGKYGPNTAAGIRKFQESIGREPNGFPDSDTLLNLFGGLFSN